MSLTLWRITPVAAPDDPRWLDHERCQEVIVLAGSPGEARAVAASADTGPDQGGVGNESANNHSGFLDEKLYRVDQTTATDAHVPSDTNASRIVSKRH